MTEDLKKQTSMRLSFTSDFGKVNNSDFVIEAVSENFDLKAKIFQQLSEKNIPERYSCNKYIIYIYYKNCCQCERTY